jgi:hypothetical protein
MPSELLKLPPADTVTPLPHASRSRPNTDNKNRGKQPNPRKSTRLFADTEQYDRAIPASSFLSQLIRKPRMHLGEPYVEKAAIWD